MTFPSVRLSDLLDPVSRPESVESDREYRLLGTRWYAGGLFVKDEKAGRDIQAKALYRVEAGDFVYNRLFAWKGSFALASVADHGCYVSNEFPCFRPRLDRLDGRYLQWYFSREAIWNEALGLSTGGTPTSRNRLKEDKLLSLEIRLPPLHEQQRIVVRIEALAAKIEEVRALRDLARPVRLLRSLIDASVSDSKWPRMPLGELLLESQNGLAPRPKLEPPGTRILRISAATSSPYGVIDEADYRYLELPPDQLKKFTINRGDLLACRFNGNLDYVGRVALFEGNFGEAYVFPDKLIRLRVDGAKADSSYLRSALNSSSVRAEIEAKCATTAGNIGISATGLKSVEVPVPPLSEQQRIVAHLCELQAKIDVVRCLQAEMATEFDALMPSILDRAFRGEL